ncbi:two-component sensor histidine kinase [Staphylococcus simulans]|uniref:HAMP domain-containing histidine kinase n=1 Tax=Staphylococcus simulans TaxID=1286 RepID=UPI000D1D1D0E|nr:HAMP domain-containing histidine kinase [Staphylococcus simulans]PTJ34802.1 two-component sensor histidine kinase [Staphylococcus simulans]
MKQRKLKTQWMLITTSITFLIVFIFSLVIIYFLSITLRDSEINDAEKSADNVSALLATKSLVDIKPLDLNASLGNFQKVILFDNDKQKITETSTMSDFINSTKGIEPSQYHSVYVQRIKDANFLIVSHPVETEKFHGYSVIIHSLASYDSVMHSLIILSVLFGIIAIIITATISYIFSAQIAKPITIMANKMRKIRRDGFQEKLELPTEYDETTDLIDTFNDMMIQIEELFDQQRQFVEDASHELRTPLQIIQGHLNLIQRWGKKDPAILEESLDITIEEMNRITKLVEELLLLTKESTYKDSLDVEPVDVNDEIKSRLKSLKQLHPDYSFTFTPSVKPIWLNINRYQLEQVLLIFLDNAIKYDTREKRIEICTALKNRQATIEITDHGSGIPKKDLDFIFDRFYRVDKSRSRQRGGNGLGLSIAQNIVNLHGGTIQVESEVDTFTTFKITFNV